MIKNYIKNQTKKAVIVSISLVLLAGGYYITKIAAIKNSSPALSQIKNEITQIEQFTQEKMMLKNKIEKLSILDSEETARITKNKKYEMDPKAESEKLVEIFNALSQGYELFDVIVADVAHNPEYLNLLDVRLVVSSSDTAGLNNEDVKNSYTKKMRELVVLYLYKNKAAFSIYNDIEKINSDMILFRVIKRG